MGSKLFPSCFPRSRRWRRDSKAGPQEPPSPGSPSEGPEEAPGPRTRSTPSTSSDPWDQQGGRAYFSGKARVSFRHQLDSERDSTA
nr:uncharacterized protein C17orf114 homolog [Anolis sagrei ordinatus]